jgi:hypothetical protein
VHRRCGSSSTSSTSSSTSSASSSSNASVVDAAPDSTSSNDAEADTGPDATAIEAGPDAAAESGVDAGEDASDAPSLPTTANLILNPGAEASTGSTDGSLVQGPIPDWETSGEANVIQYGASGGFPQPTDPGPTDRGMNFFGGGPEDPLSIFTQTIDLSSYRAFIADGNVSFTLSAYLGGYSSQDDDAVLTVLFLGAEDGGVPDDAAAFTDDGGVVTVGSSVLGSVTIGPVTAAERQDQTGLLPVMTTGSVPVGTVAAEVQLVMTRYEGSNDDGYADNLSLTIGN